ncbi:MAG: hypothetical protein SPL35_08495 [Bacteroidales bacterium]|nr:hypothetical protein [Bacteroidales bacterium]
MKKIAVYTITSGLHDEKAVKFLSDSFLKGIFPDADGNGKDADAGFDFEGSDFGSFGTHTLDLIYVRTGGAEGIFKALLPELLKKNSGANGRSKPFYLLTSGASNSLAASLEILSFLRQQGLAGEVLHGSNEYISGRIGILCKSAGAIEKMQGMTLGVVGKPSDWLISSHADPEAFARKLGFKMLDIPMTEMVEAVKATRKPAMSAEDPEKVREALPGAKQIHEALKTIAGKYKLNALTLRCFDLLTTVGNTGCLALSSLNAEGIPAACEGDVPALLSMIISQAATGKTGFQANPARIDVGTGEMLFAHCTVPLNMITDYCYDTHFESGIGVGIHGTLPDGPVTVFKVSGDLSRCFAADGDLLRNQYEPNLCRTQVVLKLRPEDAKYFLTDPIGNHHIIIPGHHAALLKHIVDSL